MFDHFVILPLKELRIAVAITHMVITTILYSTHVLSKLIKSISFLFYATISVATIAQNRRPIGTRGQSRLNLEYLKSPVTYNILANATSSSLR